VAPLNSIVLIFSTTQENTSVLQWFAETQNTRFVVLRTNEDFWLLGHDGLDSVFVSRSAQTGKITEALSAWAGILMLRSARAKIWRFLTGLVLASGGRLGVAPA
jgi:hypothetical protein